MTVLYHTDSIELQLTTPKYNQRSKTTPSFLITVGTLPPPVDPSASPKARKRKQQIQLGTLVPDLGCDPGMKTCAVPGRTGVWECVDIMANLEMCGGCVGEEAVDCSAMEGVDVASCEKGRCYGDCRTVRC
jgi:hypothetical protein